MTALNIMLRPNSGYLYSDAAVWAPDGTVTKFQSKLFPIPKIGAVVAIRGTTLTDRCFLESALAECADVGELLEALPLLAIAIREFTEAISEFTQEVYHADVLFVEMMAMAWLQNEGHPAAWSTTTLDPNSPGYPGLVQPGPDSGPNRLVHTPMFHCAPGFDRALLKKPLACLQDALNLDPVVDGLDILEAQRREAVEIPGIGPLHIVGGFAEMATVNADGVSVQTLRVWPDEIGRRIEPGRD